MHGCYHQNLTRADKMSVDGQQENYTSVNSPRPACRYEREGSCIIVCDAWHSLRQFPDRTLRCCVTSPPYWGLRDYGIPHQIGAEKTLSEYIANLSETFQQVKRVLRDDGTLWLNIGDSYTSGNRTWRDADKKNPARGMDYRPQTPKGENERSH